MGAWGAGTFDNDDALDWVSELEESRDESVLRRALEPVATASVSQEVEAPAGSCAVAAAEVVAASLGAPAELTEESQRWVDQHGTTVSGDALTLARQAVARVLGEKSELRELWDDAVDGEWRRSVIDLARRLDQIG